MPESSVAKRFLNRGTADDEDKKPWRNGFGGDNASGFHPFCLVLKSKDGRHMQGPSLQLFTWHDWLDGGGPIERLVILFSVGGVYVEGIHMKAKVEALLQEGKLKYIQQHDELEIEAIRAHNLDVREPDKKEPIVLRIVVAPDLKTRLEGDKDFAAIAAAMKGKEGGETRIVGKSEG
jgi:hypothetical protein